jgi:hypothetical protein
LGVQAIAASDSAVCSAMRMRLGRMSDAAQVDLTVRSGRGHDVVRLDAGELFRTVRGELPRPARCCHISMLFQSVKAQ